MQSRSSYIAKPRVEVLEERIALSHKAGHGGGKPPSEPTAEYELIDVGTLSGHTGSELQDVNNSGIAVGGSYLSGAGATQRAVLLIPEDTDSDGQLDWYSPIDPADAGNALLTELTTVAPADLLFSGALAVNEHGQVAGFFRTIDNEYHPFLITPQDKDGDGDLEWNWDGNADGVNDLMTDLGSLGGVGGIAADLNDQGQVVGWSTDADGITTGFVWDPISPNAKSGTMIDLGSFGVIADDFASQAYDINESGQIVGHALVYNSIGGIAWRGFVITPEIEGDVQTWYADENGDGINDLMVDLGVLDNETSQANAINDGGVVVGEAGSDLSSFNGHAVRWTESSGAWEIEDLGGLHRRLFTSTAFDVSNAGTVVGYSQEMVRSAWGGGGFAVYSIIGDERAFVHDGEMKALDTLVSDLAGFDILPRAYGIGDGGHIVGVGIKGEIGRGYIAVPVTSGSSLVAAAGPSQATTETLTVAQVNPLVSEAMNRWQSAGVDTSGLDHIQTVITDLPGSMLGMAAGNTIFLDINAAGWGWFVDPTPWEDSEFTTPGDQGEQNRMDLLTVIGHELGHLLGYEHEEEGVMQETLVTGQRHLLSQSEESEMMLFALAKSKTVF